MDALCQTDEYVYTAPRSPPPPSAPPERRPPSSAAPECSPSSFSRAAQVRFRVQPSPVRGARGPRARGTNAAKMKDKSHSLTLSLYHHLFWSFARSASDKKLHLPRNCHRLLFGCPFCRYANRTMPNGKPLRAELPHWEAWAYGWLKACLVGRSSLPQWGSIRFRPPTCTYAPRGPSVRAGELTEARKNSTQTVTLRLFLVIGNQARAVSGLFVELGADYWYVKDRAVEKE